MAGLRSASVKDSLAICSYFCWLEAFLKDPAAAPPPPAVPKTAAAFQPKPLASFVLCLLAFRVAHKIVCKWLVWRLNS